MKWIYSKDGLHAVNAEHVKSIQIWPTFKGIFTGESDVTAYFKGFLAGNITLGKFKNEALAKIFVEKMLTDKRRNNIDL